MQGGAHYRARDDDSDTFREWPARKCMDCGSICPDVEKIDELDAHKVPTSVRLRCAKMRLDG